MVLPKIGAIFGHFGRNENFWNIFHTKNLGLHRSTRHAVSPTLPNITFFIKIKNWEFSWFLENFLHQFSLEKYHFWFLSLFLTNFANHASWIWFISQKWISNGGLRVVQIYQPKFIYFNYSEITTLDY